MESLPNLPLLTFHDPLSALAASVSVAAWGLWLMGVVACLMILWTNRLREARVTVVAGDFGLGSTPVRTD
jgi:hypothetical protein